MGEGYLTSEAKDVILPVVHDCLLSLEMPGPSQPRQVAAEDERGMELLAYAARAEEARLLVIVRHGRIVRWRRLPHRRMARP